MKTEDCFSIEFEITPPGSDRYYDDDGADDYTDWQYHCDNVRKRVGLPGNVGSDADGPELRISKITWDDWPKVQLMCEQLRSDGFYASRRTGAHVHFDVRKYLDARYDQYQDYSEAALEQLRYVSPKYGRFLYSWLTFENALYRICKTSAHRKDQWSTSIRHRYRPYITGSVTEEASDFYAKFFEGSENIRHLQVLQQVGKASIYPVTWYGSAEVRMHDGTLNDVRMGAWIELIQSMMEGAHNFPITYYQDAQYQELNTGTNYERFKAWLTEIDPSNAPQFITILEKETP